MKYIGVATGQHLTATATALTTLRANNGIPDWAQMDNLFALWQPEAIVVGLPTTLDGQVQPIFYCARKFAKRLKARYKLEVHFADERLTTKMALTQLASHHKKTDFKLLNAKAAEIMLQDWLAGNPPR